jgi:hypothetical protein
MVKPSNILHYDIIIGNANYTDGKLFERQIQLAHARRPDAKWVVLIEGCATDYIRPMKLLQELFAVADLVNVINKYSVSLFRAMTATRVEYLGIPYPVDGVGAHVVPFEKRVKRTLICPRLLNRQNDYWVAKQVGIDYYGYERRIPRRWRNLPTLWAQYGNFKREAPILKAEQFYRDSELTIRKEIYGATFYTDNADARFWINLDERYTWGRYVLDAAALRMPIITTRSTGHGEDLFPETTLQDEFDLEQAIELGKRLANDDAFYRHVATYPVGKMERFKHEPMKEKLLNLLYTSRLIHH